MEVKAGYKQTELGVIPDEWKVSTVGAEFDFMKTSTAARSELFEGDQGVGYIHYGDIHTTFPANLEVDFDTLPKIDKEQAKGKTRLKVGDLVVADASEDLTGVCQTIELTKLSEGIEVISGLHTFLLRTKSYRFHIGFGGYLFNSELMRSQYLKRYTGMKVFGLSKTAFKNIWLPIPSKEEQQAIAEALSDVDALIVSLEKLVKKKQGIRSGTLQAMVSGTRRIEGHQTEWKQSTIGELAEIRSGGTPSTANSAFWDGGIPWCTPTELSALDGNRYISGTNRHISELGLATSSAELIPSNSVILSSRATIGECAINLVPMATNQGFKNLVPKSHCDSMFLLYLCRFLKPRFLAAASGSTFLEIGKSTLQSIEVFVPEIEEQMHIGQIMNELDEEIELLKQRLAKAKKIKVGMMQELLTGKMRLT